MNFSHARRLLRRFGLALGLALALLASQQLAAWHDVGHLDAGAPSSFECGTHYLCSQVGGGPVSLPPALVFDAGTSPPAAFLRQRDASIPARLAYRAQAPPDSPT